jgi:hypothetical protein
MELLMKGKNSITKALSLTVGMLFCASSFAANWNIAVGDGGGSLQEVLGVKFSQLLSEKQEESILLSCSSTAN